MKAVLSYTRSFINAIPGFLVSLIPLFKSCPPCPMCMPKYAAILSLLGLELADYSAYLTPLMLISFAYTIISTYIYRTRFGLSLAPWGILVAACGGILVSKFVLDAMNLVYAAMFVFFIGLIWHNSSMTKAEREHAQKHGGCKSGCCGHSHEDHNHGHGHSHSH